MQFLIQGTLDFFSKDHKIILLLLLFLLIKPAIIYYNFFDRGSHNI